MRGHLFFKETTFCQMEPTRNYNNNKKFSGSMMTIYSSLILKQHQSITLSAASAGHE